jgi:hypothetical protein
MCGCEGPDQGNPGDASADAGIDSGTAADATANDAANGTDAGMEADASQGQDAGPSVSFRTIQASFQTQCSCHMNNPGSGNLDLSSANAYADLVNVNAFMAPTKLRVKPYDAENSFLWHKLTGDLLPGEGSRMPELRASGRGGPSADTALSDQVRDWINAGALND